MLDYFLLRRAFKEALKDQASAKEWYDRNPTHRVLYWDGYGLAPHVSTLRASYVCPDHRKALVQAIFNYSHRVTAATTLGLVISDINTVVTGNNYLFERNVFYDNADNYAKTNARDCHIQLMPKEEIRFFTLDFSTGGTLNFIMTAIYTEFDY